MINKFRIKVMDGQTDAIRFLSSMDRTSNLTQRTDEECVIGRDEVCVIKNLSDSPACLLLIGHDHSNECGRTVFRPSRQAMFTLWKAREVVLVLEPGESCPIQCEAFRMPHTPRPELGALRT